MSRDLRYVPARWKHPHFVAKRPQGSEIAYRPMHAGGVDKFNEDYKAWEKELAEWYEGYKLWHEKGLYKGYKGEVEKASDAVARERKYLTDKGYDKWHVEDIALMDTGEYGYTEYCGEPPSPPNPRDYMPFGKWVQLYETVSEGTPITPPFKTKEQLVDWLATNKDFWGHQWTREQAQAMVEDEYAPSAVMQGGKLYTAEESVLLNRETKSEA